MNRLTPLTLIFALGASAPATAATLNVDRFEFDVGRLLGGDGALPTPARVGRFEAVPLDISFGWDPDGDGYSGFADNCPQVANRSQADLDADGFGDLCDPRPSDICPGGPDFMVMAVADLDSEIYDPRMATMDYLRAIYALVYRDTVQLRYAMAALYEASPWMDPLDLMVTAIGSAQQVWPSDGRAFGTRLKQLRSGELPLDFETARILADYCAMAEVGLSPAVERR